MDKTTSVTVKNWKHPKKTDKQIVAKSDNRKLYLKNFKTRLPKLCTIGGHKCIKNIKICMRIGEGNGNPLQYSCLENPVDRGDWWAAVVHRVAQSQTQLKRISVHSWEQKHHIMRMVLSGKEGTGMESANLHGKSWFMSGRRIHGAYVCIKVICICVKSLKITRKMLKLRK